MPTPRDVWEIGNTAADDGPRSVTYSTKLTHCADSRTPDKACACLPRVAHKTRRAFWRILYAMGKHRRIQSSAQNEEKKNDKKKRATHETCCAEIPLPDRARTTSCLLRPCSSLTPRNMSCTCMIERAAHTAHGRSSKRVINREETTNPRRGWLSNWPQGRKLSV